MKPYAQERGHGPYYSNCKCGYCKSLKRTKRERRHFKKAARQDAKRATSLMD